MSVKSAQLANLVEHWDFRKGSLDGSEGTNTSTPSSELYWVNSSRGYAIQVPDSGQITLGASTVHQIDTFTLMAWVNPRNFDAIAPIFSLGAAQYYFGLNTLGRIVFSFSDAVGAQQTNPTASGTVIALEDTLIGITVIVDGSNVTLRFYKNGTFVSEVVETSGWNATYGTTAYIGTFSTGTLPFDGYIREVIQYNTVFTDEQMSDWYTESLQEGALMGQTHYCVSGKRISAEDTTALLDLTMEPERGQLKDVSGNENHFDVNNNGISGSKGATGFEFGNLDGGSGASQTSGFTSSSAQYTFEMVVNPSAAAGNFDYLFDSNSPRFVLAWGGANARLATLDSGGSFQEFTTNSNPAAGHPWHLVWTFDSDANEAKLYVNGQQWGDTLTFAATDIPAAKALMNTYTGTSPSGNSFDGKLNSHFRIFESLKDTDWIEARYLEFAKKPVYLNDFKDVPVTISSVSSGELGGFKIKSGSYDITDDGTDRWLECLFNGIVSLPLTQAYGTWEFDFYKGSVSNISVLMFAVEEILVNTDTNQSGYYILSESNGDNIGYAITTNGSRSFLSESSDGYIAPQTKYTLRIKRTALGEFTMYIKGGVFTDWTLTDSGQTGTNPATNNVHTTSKYFVLDLDAGDKISNIKMYPGELTPTQLT